MSSHAVTTILAWADDTYAQLAVDKDHISVYGRGFDYGKLQAYANCLESLGAIKERDYVEGLVEKADDFFNKHTPQ